MILALGSVNLTASTSGICPEVTFTCLAMEISDSLRWFFNDVDTFALYAIIPDDVYPLSVQPLNATYNELVGRVDIQIIEASTHEDNPELFGFLSTMAVNIFALQRAGISKILCGTSGTMDAVTIEQDLSSEGSLTLR